MRSAYASAGAIPLAIPASISLNMIDRWSRMMRLSEAQHAFVLQLHSEYVRSDAEMREANLSRLRERAAELGPHFFEAYSNVEHAEQLRRLNQNTHRAVVQIIQHERASFFQLIEPILSHEQIELLLRVQQVHERHVYSKALSRILPGSGVDVSRLIDQMDLDGTLSFTSFTDRKHFLDVLAIYETALTDALRRHHDLKYRLMADGPLLRARQRIDANPEILRARLNQLSRQVYQAEQSIVDLHEMYLPMLCDHLTDGSARTLTNLFHRRAYPQVYPNPFDLDEVFDHALAIEHLTEEQRESIHAVAVLTRERQKVIGDRMNREISEWVGQFLRTYELDPREIPEHKAKLDDMHAERRSMAEQGIEMLMQVFSENDQDRLRPVIAEFWEYAATFQPRDTGLNYSPATLPADQRAPWHGSR